MTTENIVPLSQLKDYELMDATQDIRGWPMKDQAGASLGTVTELLVDTKAERVTVLVLDNGQTYDAAHVSLGEHVVVMKAGSLDAVKSAGGAELLRRTEEFLRVGKTEASAERDTLKMRAAGESATSGPSALEGPGEGEFELA